MNTFLLEVIAPFIVGSPHNNANQLGSELVTLADEHTGIVLEPLNACSKNHFHRCCVDMSDEEYSLAKEVEGLRKKYPDTRFILEEESMPTE
jgi:hypothetical protein